MKTRIMRKIEELASYASRGLDSVTAATVRRNVRKMMTDRYMNGRCIICGRDLPVTKGKIGPVCRTKRHLFYEING